MNRGAWQTMVQGVAQSDMTEMTEHTLIHNKIHAFDNV